MSDEKIIRKNISVDVRVLWFLAGAAVGGLVIKIMAIFGLIIIQ